MTSAIRRAVSSVAMAWMAYSLWASLPKLVRGATSSARRRSSSDGYDDNYVVRTDADYVTVLIPARNEALRLRPTLDALRAMPQVGEIIVIDDQSTDDTAKIAADAGATVIQGEPLPPGWVGKPWALQQGLDHVSTRRVAAIDADARPSKDLFTLLLAEMSRTGSIAVCANGALRTTSTLHAAVQSSLLATLIYRFGAPRLIDSSTAPSDVVANGQCMLFDTQDFKAVGGFALSGAHMTDDVALVRELHRLGRCVGSIDATDCLVVDMYDSPRETISGWTRSLLFPGVASTAEQNRTLAVVGGYSIAPLAALLVGTSSRSARLLVALTYALRIGTALGSRRAIADQRAGVVLSPLLDAVTWLALVRARLRPQLTWRGRAYASSMLEQTESQ